MGFEIGGTIDTYRITGVVGRGGMGRVYQVEHTITKRVEAMKVVIGGQPDSEEHAQRFLTEIRLQASLSHPNIASVYNAFWLNGDLVLVMELVEGPSLQDLLEAGPIPLDTGIGYGRQALRALRYAHDNGVIHRDVSPGNILVAPDGTIKLTDFGIAKSLSGPHYTEQGEALGSVYYAAPEQLKGLPEVDGRADVYSLGAVLYELATGQTVFEADSLYDVMRAQIETEPVPPVEVNPKIPPALNGAILRALAKDPAARFQSANAFLEALEELPGGSALAPAEAAPAALPERHRRWTPACLLAPLRTAVPVVFAAVIFAALALAVWRDVDSRRSLARAAPGGARPAVQAVPPRPAAIPSRAAPEATGPVVTETEIVIPGPETQRVDAAVRPAPPARRRARTRRTPPVVAQMRTTGAEPASMEPMPLTNTAPVLEEPPVEIAIGKVAEPPAAAPPENVPQEAVISPEAAPTPPRHWLWRALGKIPLPVGRKKSESDQTLKEPAPSQ